MKTNPVKFESKFIKKEKLTDGIYSFYFERKKDFKYFPGQYIRLTLQINNPDGRGSSRYFTISSSPTDLDYFTITTRIIKSSFKKRLANLKPNEKVKVYGPMGCFDFDIKNKKPKLFLAGGIGITPYHSILKSLENKKNLPEIILIVSFSKKEDVIYFDELKKIESNNPKNKIIYTLTKDVTTDKFESGRISENLIIKYCPNYLDYEIFIVGSELFEEDLITLVKNMKVSGENIFTENFPGY